LLGRFRHLPHRDPAELYEISGLELAHLADPDHNQARHLEPCRGDNVESRGAFALEALGRGRTGHKISCLGKDLAGRRAKLEALVTKHDKNAPWGRRKRGKFELEGHANSLRPASGSAGNSYRDQTYGECTDMTRLLSAAKPLVHGRHRHGKC